jgi:AAA15 family ATPase/GTPase
MSSWVPEVAKMLLQFTVENYRSFRDEAVLSLIPGSDAEHTNNIINKGKEKALKSVVLLGANASGKSNIIKAIGNAIMMIRESASIQLESPLFRITPFELDGVSSEKPSRFEFIFETGGIRYMYGFSATVERITKEYLYAYYSVRPTTIFERTGDEYIFKTDKKLLESLVSKNNSNKLFLATATSWNYERTKAPYLWFANSIVTYAGSAWSRDYLAFANDSGGMQKRFTSKLLEIADINISDYQALEIDVPKEHIKTEKMYFSAFNAAQKNYRVVFAPGNDTDPQNMIRTLKEYMREIEFGVSCRTRETARRY